MTEIIELKQEELKSIQTSFLKMIGNDSYNIKQVKFEPFNKLSIHYESENSEFDLYLFLGLVDNYFEDFGYQVCYNDNHLILVEIYCNPYDIPAIAFAPTSLEEALNHDFFEMVINGLELPEDEVKEEVAAKYHKEIENIEARKEREKYCKWSRSMKDSYHSKHVSIDEIIKDDSSVSKFVILSREFLGSRSPLEIEIIKDLLDREDQINRQAILLEYDAECTQELPAEVKSHQWILLSLNGKRIDKIKSRHDSLEELFYEVKNDSNSYSIFKFITLSDSSMEEMFVTVDGIGLFIAKRLNPDETMHIISEEYFFDLLDSRKDLPIKEWSPF